MIKKTILLLVIFMFNAWIISSDETQDIVSEDNNNLIYISEITVINNTYTNSSIILDGIGISVGDRYTTETKDYIYLRVASMRDIIQSADVTEIFDDQGNVKLIIYIDEKFPMLLLPFFTYSNSKGLQPKIIIRHYNLAGFRKFLNAKIEFIPTTELYMWARLSENSDTIPDRISENDFNSKILEKLTDQADIDFIRIAYNFDGSQYRLTHNLSDDDRTRLIDLFNALMFNKALSYSVEANLGTSLPNYFITGIPPLGVFGSSFTGTRWNDTPYINMLAKGQLSFQIPGTTASITQKFGIDKYRLTFIPQDTNPEIFTGVYQNINPYYEIDMRITDPRINASYIPSFKFNYEGGTDLNGVSENIHLFNIQNSLNLGYPIRGTNLTLKPYYTFKYILAINRSRTSEKQVNGINYDYLAPVTGVNLSIPVPQIGATVTPGISFSLVRSSSSNNSRLTSYDDYVISGDTTAYINIYAGFSRVIKLQNITNETTFSISYSQPLFRITERYGLDPTITAGRFNDFYADAKFINNFEIKYFGDHRFIMNWVAFTSYNHIQELGGQYNSSSYSIKLNDISYLRGFAGLACKLQLVIPLFYFTTTKFLTMETEKELNWQMDWLIFINGGFSFNDSDLIIGGIMYTIPVRVLRILPSIVVGTSIRLYPRFLASFIRLDLGLDLYRIIKSKGINGSLSLVFNIGDDI